jgi:hypothetical protein
VFLLSLAVYAVVMLSVTVLRTISASTQDGSPIEEIAIGIVMCCSSTGAAFLAESLMRKRAPAVRLAKAHRNMQRRLRSAERRQLRAQRHLDRRDDEARKQGDQIARDRALYNATHTYTKGHE